MKKKLLYNLFCIGIFVPISVLAESKVSSWYLPKKLSDLNTKVTFEVDSTWNLIKTVTSSLHGTANLEDLNDPTTVNVLLNLPVEKFETGSSMHNGRMREVMLIEKYPEVIFSGKRLLKRCTPALVIRDGKCSETITAELTMLSKTLPITMPIQVSYESDSSFVISGQVPIVWGDFGIEDPSMFVNRLDPIANVSFKTYLRPER